MANVKGSASLTASVKTINPAVAKTMLKKRARNRGISSMRVSRYSQAMEKNEWVIAQPLMVNCDGTLIDGQHRLHAVLQCQKPVKFLVIEGYDRDGTFAVVDEIYPRKLAHWLQVRGEPVTDVLSSVILMAARDEAGLVPTASGTGFIQTPVEGLEFLDSHPRLRSIVTGAPGTVNTYASRSIQCFAYHKFVKLDKTLANDFFVSLTTGHNEGNTDPIFLLRERLKSNRRSKSKLTRTDILALFIKAWNACRQLENGEDPALGQGLRWRSTGPTAEPFPEPI